jgi:hypothetical protein
MASAVSADSGSERGRFVVSLRLFGDDLDPAAISASLGAQPTDSWRKGDVISRQGRLARSGKWQLTAADAASDDIGTEVAEILGRLSGDPAVWSSLARYGPDLFCGVFTSGSNDTLPLSTATLQALVQRGITLTVDIYENGEAGEWRAAARRAAEQAGTGPG